MSKKIKYGVIGLAAVALAASLSYSYHNHQASAIQKEVVSSEKSDPKTKYVASSTEYNEAVKEIGNVPDEETLISRMMEMSLQKVKVGDQNFTVPGVVSDSLHRIQMTKGNIDYLKQKLGAIQVSRNDRTDGYDYESILNRWLEGNFEDITKEFEALRTFISKPSTYDNDSEATKVTKKNKAEEQEYILHFFGEDALKFQNKQWNTAK